MGQDSPSRSCYNIWKEHEIELPTPRFVYYRAGDKNVGMMLTEVKADCGELHRITLKVEFVSSQRVKI